MNIFAASEGGSYTLSKSELLRCAVGARQVRASGDAIWTLFELSRTSGARRGGSLMRLMGYLRSLGIAGATGLMVTDGARAARLAQTSSLAAQTIPFETRMQFDRFESSFCTLT